MFWEALGRDKEVEGIFYDEKLCDTEIKKRIARRVRQSGLEDESKLTNLVIDGCQSKTSLTDTDRLYLEKFVNIEFLTFSDCGITSLVNMPTLPKLVKLEMLYNKIESGLEHLLVYPKLMFLKFRHNKIAKFEVLVPLQKLRELYENPICDEKSYRRNVF